MTAHRIVGPHGEDRANTTCVGVPKWSLLASKVSPLGNVALMAEVVMLPVVPLVETVGVAGVMAKPTVPRCRHRRCARAPVAVNSRVVAPSGHRHRMRGVGMHFGRGA